MESGLISLTPEGGFTERHEKSSDEAAALLQTRQPRELLAAYPHHIVPLPTPGRVRTQARTRANRFYLDYQVLSQGGGQGRADGAAPRQRAQIEGGPIEDAGRPSDGSGFGRLRGFIGKRLGKR
ncbi:hypothetical protein BJF79_41930 [Actinomadura sp. CNU-125]|uniref:hypothetical protein n=1 Tax=Actinomadura sp. CNU-125 TaxID=1904961 RepID=UPI0009685E85|nr:hypothetical protein [Actinomadura sp. CNU-125]OLT28089.1 hypothetical protein BJF79_41930 [Actinomadura sp. CNU-125]